MPAPPLSAVYVVIPARNEADLVGACLKSVLRAGRTLEHRTSLPVSIVVVCDACVDHTATLARALLSPVQGVVLEGDFRNVGRARAEGALLAQRLSDATPTESIWYAFTDADSRVPERWLTSQFEHARSGAEAVLGTVRLDPLSLSAPLLKCFEARYAMKIGRKDHQHIHGANFGVRADHYWRAGGFEWLPMHEDRRLVQHLEARCVNIVRDTAIPVITSGRRHGRVVQGVSVDLRRLASGNFT